MTWSEECGRRDPAAGTAKALRKDPNLPATVHHGDRSRETHIPHPQTKHPEQGASQMAKRVYSLVLSDEVVAAADRLAGRLGTNRSGLINHILAEYFSCGTHESAVRDIFSAVEELLGAREVFRVSGADSRLCLRSALDYKYNPTVHYTVELTAGGGEFRAYLRTQNTLLLLYMNAFFRLWTSLDGAGSRCGEDGSFSRRFARITAKDDPQKTAERISEYVGAFDSAMKAYFASLDDAATAEAEVRRIHGSLKTGD